jgi:aminomethyltransferase
VPIGTAVHERTFALCESLNYREWSGYYAVSAYEAHHEHEYNAIRNAAALIDVSPLFKYRISGKDAAKFINRVIARDIEKVAVGQVIYCCWCDEKGKVIDDGTISRLGESAYRWTAAEPNLRWFTENARGMEVEIEDISDRVAALALQGPTSCRVLKRLVGNQISSLKYFRVAPHRIAGVDVEISRTGYTGDLGYELWIPWDQAVNVWDAVMEAGQPYDIHAVGMLALDVARIEAGLILLDVEYTSSKRALIETQKYSPYEIGLGKLVNLKKQNFVGKGALVEEQKRGSSRQLVGLNLEWEDIEKLFDAAGLAPQVAAAASRAAVPVYRGRKQAGKATSTTWSPTLKRMIALGILNREDAATGTRLEMELTVEAVRHTVRVTVAELPFFNPARKMATPAE